MVEAQDVKDYLNLLPAFKLRNYADLDSAEQDKAIFSATETLNDYFGEKVVTAKGVALQTLYEVEAETEEYAVLKRHGLSDAKYSDTQIKFKEGAIHISPQVLLLYVVSGGANTGGGSTGRLI